jgi:RNA polymerase sigma factor (sigma-70 family)
MNKGHARNLKDLIQRCRSGDEEAWHELIDYVAPLVFSICRNCGLSRDESFDIFGQVSYQLLKAIDTIQEPESTLSLVATIARRQIYHYYKKIHAIDEIGSEEMQMIAADIVSDPEQLYVNLKRREILMDAMLELPEKDYKLLKELFLDPNEPSYKEIAARLRMPVSSIGPLRAKALAKLHRILKRKGLDS